MKTCIAAGLACGLVGWAGGACSEGQAAEQEPIQLVVEASVEPVPSLKYTLVYEKIDQVPGNAALAYQRVIGMLATSEGWSKQREKCSEWLKVPAAEFPTEDAKKLLDQQAHNLGQLLKATHYEDCDWGIPMREEGMNALLPHLSEVRGVSKLLALDIRYLTLQGRYPEAVERLRAGLTLAQHVGDGSLLIESLVGLAVANQMLDQVEELVAQPGAPNLYWALTDRPSDVFSAWRAVRWERSYIYVHFPVLWKARAKTVTLDDLHRSVGELRRLTGEVAQVSWLSEEEEVQVLSAGFALAVYPKACQRLVAQGIPRDTVREMSVPQVLATYIARGYDIQRDNLFKWFGVSYPQAWEGLERARMDLFRATEADPIQTMLPSMLLPALGSVIERFADFDRRLAMLRGVEAIRDYLARHDGRLPATLAEVRELPVPEDPMTGRPFLYRLEGATAELTTPESPAVRQLRERTYRITLRP